MSRASLVPLNPGRLHQALTSYQLAMAVKGAIDLDLFTHVIAGATTPAAIAALCQGSERGVRVLCDYLTVHGFLSKVGGTYAVASDVAPLVDRRSPDYMGSVAGYFTHPLMIARYDDVAALVRNGGAVDHTLAPNDPIWVEFARHMASMSALSAGVAAPILTMPGRPEAVLDIAAGHGLFGIHVALRNPAAAIAFQDWDNVLDVARENATRQGLAGRFHTIPGALFAMRMLGTTPSGDAYTAAEFDRMLREAGFGPGDVHNLAPAPQTLITAVAARP